MNEDNDAYIKAILEAIKAHLMRIEDKVDTLVKTTQAEDDSLELYF